MSKETLNKLCEELKLEVDTQDRVVEVELWYPRTNDGRPDTVEIGLTDVRAADSIRVSYDFDRDGWVIWQATRFSWEADEVPSDCWVEVSFVQAWGSKIPGPGDEGYVWKDAK